MCRPSVKRKLLYDVEAELGFPVVVLVTQPYGNGTSRPLTFVPARIYALHYYFSDNYPGERAGAPASSQQLLREPRSNKGMRDLPVDTTHPIGSREKVIPASTFPLTIRPFAAEVVETFTAAR